MNEETLELLQKLTKMTKDYFAGEIKKEYGEELLNFLLLLTSFKIMVGINNFDNLPAFKLVEKEITDIIFNHIKKEEKKQ